LAEIDVVSMQFVFGVVLVMLLCGGCGEPVPRTPASTASSAPETAAAPGPSREIAAIDACELLPLAEVARIAGGTLATTESSWTGPQCMYVVDVAGGTEGYVLRISAPADVAVVIDYLDPAERGESQKGPWPEAYLGPKEFGEGLRLLVLDRGDFALSVDGESRREPIIEIATRAYTRVKAME
jgi:hypothetical protein